MKCLICYKKTGISKIKCKMCGMPVAVEYGYGEYAFCSQKCVNAFSRIAKYEENSDLLKRKIVL